MRIDKYGAVGFDPICVEGSCDGSWVMMCDPEDCVSSCVIHVRDVKYGAVGCWTLKRTYLWTI